jgi:hypothetical protein
LKIISTDPGINLAFTSIDTDRKELSIYALTYSNSKDLFISLNDDVLQYFESIGKIDKLVVEFSRFGFFASTMPHFFILGTLYGLSRKVFKNEVYFFTGKKNDQYGIAPSTWASFMKNLLGLGVGGKFDKDESLAFGNDLLWNLHNKGWEITSNAKRLTNHITDSLSIGYYYLKKEKNIDLLAKA